MFKNAIPLFTLMGFRVRLDPSWFVIAVVIVWSLAGDYFPAQVPAQPFSLYLSLGVLGMLGLFGSLLLHEVAHSLVARAYGLKVGGITLFIFGGVAELVEEPRDPGSEFWIAVAGPAMSFALAFGFQALLGVTALGPVATPTQALLAYLALANLALAIFNLLPAFPMDGGRVLRAILWRVFKDLDRATLTASRIGTVLGGGVIALGVLSVLSGGGVGGFWLVLIGFFIFSAGRSSITRMRLKSVMTGRRLADFMTRAVVTVPPEMTLDALVHEVMLGRNIGFVPVVSGGKLLGYVDRAALAGLDRASWPKTPVSQVMVARDAANTLPPDIGVTEALESLAGSGRRKVMVAEGDKLGGVVALADLWSYFQMSQEIGAGR